MSDDLEDERALVRRAQAGDGDALEGLTRRHLAAVHRYCARTAGPVRAADLAQDAMLRMMRGIRGFDGRARFRTWLFTIARNVCIDDARKRKHRQTESLDQTSNEKWSVDPGEAGAERSLDRKRLRIALSAAVDQLPEAQREVFLLREEAGLSFKEIAEVTGASENTVKSRMRYALQALKSALIDAGWTP
ncbi:MAG: sigma-70 family RNA polymerase sigma factor [Myxococcota bacterium]